MNTILNNPGIYSKLLEILRAGTPCVFATVTGVHGSTPQKAGSSAVFDKQRLIEGTIGGGSVEHRIQKRAIDAVQSKKSGIFRFELNDDISGEESAICGGGMTILVDASPEKHIEVFEQLTNSISNRIPGVLATIGKSDESGRLNLVRKWITYENASSEAGNLSADAAREVNQMLNKPTAEDFREIIVHTSPDAEDNFTFLETIVPLPKLVIAGAGHVGKILSHFGKLLGFKVIVWDDREEYANNMNLPDADTILTGGIENSLEKLSVDRDTFIVIVTRGHHNDSEVLKRFIDSRAGYIGMIGSKKKVIQVRENSIKEGWATPEKWDKIHAPIGLKIGSKTVEEIAVSIAAEIIQVRNSLNSQNG